MRLKEQKELNYKTVAEEVVVWLRNYAERAGARGFVVGVSGGIDSAVVSTLAARTGLNTLLLGMPIHQNKEQVSMAVKHVDWLSLNYNNIEYREIDLSQVYDATKKTYLDDLNNSVDRAVLTESVNPTSFDFSMSNTSSRLRMTTLYHYAGMSNLLVVGTGNKIEDQGIGFFTKYGDGGVDVSPIGDLMKTEVYNLGEELGVIDDIMNAAPTDGLHEDGRTDEEQIGATYEELEWAMKHHNLKRHLSTYLTDSLSPRQKVVLDIFTQRHKSNLHKTSAIPIFQVSKYRKTWK